MNTLDANSAVEPYLSQYDAIGVIFGWLLIVVMGASVIAFLGTLMHLKVEQNFYTKEKR